MSFKLRPALPAALALVALSAAPGLAGVVGASVLGDAVSGQFGVTGETPYLDMTVTAIDPGAEFIYGEIIWADLADDQLTIVFDLETYIGDGAATTWTIGDLDFAPAAKISAFSLVEGPGKLLVSSGFTDDSLTASFSDLLAAGYDGVTTFVFAFETTPASVPLPAALPLAVAGLGALGLVARRRRG